MEIPIVSIDEFVDFIKSLGPDVEIRTPQFERTNGIVPVIPESNLDWFDKLKTLPKETLVQLGMGIWGKGHYLFPKEWYSFIPNGYPVVDINGNTELFRRGETDDDIRFGCLSFGFRSEVG